MMTSAEKNKFILAYIFCAIVVLIGMFVPIMEVDAAQYASMAKQMWEENSFLEIHNRDLNYLDKPPLLFWLSGAGISLLGNSDFVYKLPSVLFSLLGIWATFKLARFYYGEKTAYWSVLMYCTSVAFFLFNNDIRTDTLLIALLVYIVYQLVAFREYGRWINFVAAFVGIGLAMTAKGPLGLIFPIMALGPDVLIKRQWKFLFNWKWILGLVIVAVVLFPMCYGLYTQFDAQPGASVNGQNGVSGLRFFFWEQSFGRITGESVWARDYSNHPDTFYLLHSFLWAFLPWTPLFLVAAVHKLRELVKNRFRSLEKEEWITVSAFLFPLLALSRSGFQLNHYIYIVIPFTAILTAAALVKAEEKGSRWLTALRPYSVIYTILLVLMGSLLLFYVFPGKFSWAFLPVFAIPIVFRIHVWKNWYWWLGVLTTSFFVIMNGWFYPNLLKYQVSKQVLSIYHEQRQEGEELYYYEMGASHSADFYNEKWIPYYQPETYSRLDKPVWIYTNSEGYSKLRDEEFVNLTLVDSFPYHRVATLNAAFFNPELRPAQLSYRYLMILKGKP